MGQALNSLKGHLQDCLVDEEAKRGVSGMRNGMMERMCKGREGHERRLLKDGYGLLWKWNRLVNEKRVVCKNIIRRTLGKNDCDLGRGMGMLRENHIRRKTFVQCRT
jgi:hypothetical protein